MNPNVSAGPVPASTPVPASSLFVTNLSAHEYNRRKARIVSGAVEGYIKDNLGDLRPADLMVLKEFTNSANAYGFGTETTDADKKISAFEPFGSDGPRPMTVAEVQALGYTSDEAKNIVAREESAYTRGEEPYGSIPRTDANSTPAPPVGPPAPLPEGQREIAGVRSTIPVPANPAPATAPSPLLPIGAKKV